MEALDFVKCVGGAWIAPDGKVTWVPEETFHGRTLTAVLGFSDGLYSTAYRAGYLRIGTYQHGLGAHPGNGGVSFDSRYVGLEAMKVARSWLRRLVEQCPRFSSDDVAGQYDPTTWGTPWARQGNPCWSAYDPIQEDVSRWFNDKFRRVSDRDYANRQPLQEAA